MPKIEEIDIEEIPFEEFKHYVFMCVGKLFFFGFVCLQVQDLQSEN